MRTTLILTISISMISFVALSQNFGTDVEGFSTIYTEGANLGLDIVNDQLRFDYFTSKKWSKDSLANRKCFFGGSFKGTANDGITNIVSSGRLNANASIDAIFGFKTISKTENKQAKLGIDKLKVKSSAYDKQIGTNKAAILERIFTFTKQYVKEQLDKLFGSRTPILSSHIDEINAKIDTLQRENYQWNSVINRIKNRFGDSANALIDSIKKYNNFEYKIENSGNLSEWEESLLVYLGDKDYKTIHIEDSIGEVIKIKKAYDSLNGEIRNLKDHFYPERHTHKFLFRASASGQAFDYDLDNDAQNLEQRIENEEFTALSLEFIYNLQFKYYNFFGFSLKGERANNFETLEPVEISLSQMGTQAQATETVNAFQGDYDTFNRYSLNADYMRVIPLNTEGKDNIYVTINPYVRHFVYENATALKNSTNLGIGFNFFNSTKNKILGGAFIQANDIFDVQSKQSIGRTTAFGLVLRYAFKGFDFKELEN